MTDLTSPSIMRENRELACELKFLIPVDVAAGDDAGRLHHQQRPTVVVDEVRAELVAEEPAGRHARQPRSDALRRARPRSGA